MQTSGEPKLKAKAPAKLNRLKRIKYSIHAHNAVFVEVEGDEDLGTTNVARVVNAVTAGRILNPKTARSQMLGSMVWGIGMTPEVGLIGVAAAVANAIYHATDKRVRGMLITIDRLL